jgi:hypothetical protein
MDMVYLLDKILNHPVRFFPDVKKKCNYQPKAMDLSTIFLDKRWEKNY